MSCRSTPTDAENLSQNRTQVAGVEPGPIKFTEIIVRSHNWRAALHRGRDFEIGCKQSSVAADEVQQEWLDPQAPDG